MLKASWWKFLVPITALALTGCNGAFWGNIVVLGVTIGIFFGTLALGKSRPTTQSGADASTSSSTRP